MNQDELLQKMIEKSMSGLEAATDFLSAEIPDVIHQLLMWHAARSALLCALGVVVLIVWAVAEVKAWKWVTDPDCPAYDPWFAYGFLGTVIVRLPLTVAVSLTINLTWLQIWLAPKVWLIEYAASLAGVKK